MSASIGLRFYHLTLKHADGRPAKHAEIRQLKDFISRFISDNSAFVSSSEIQRVYSFSDEEYINDEFENSGYIRYGTFGFESEIVDTETATIMHRRKVTHMEQIPLFYKFWFPENAEFALAGFQSFAGRSCKQMIVTRLYESFNSKFPDMRLSFRKIMPQEMRGTGFFSSQVKEITLIKRSLPRDRASAYIGADASSEINMKLSMVARRRGTLGRLADVYDLATSSDRSFLLFDDIEFDEARATVSIGGRRRNVGLIGHNSDAGVIEVSDDVGIGDNGHPSYESIIDIVNDIMKDVHGFLVGPSS